MRLMLVSALFAIAIVFIAKPIEQERELTLIFTSDVRGYLSPCGCSKPQVGGMKRMAALVRTLLKSANSFYVDAGNWTNASGRQDELKSESLMETFRSLNAAFVNVGPLDERLGSAHLENLNEISGHALGASGNRGQFQDYKLLASGVCVQSGSPISKLAEAREGTKKRVVLFSGVQAEAEKFASENLDVSLIIFSTQGDPVRTPIRIGNCLLVSVGDKCRFVGTIDLVGGEWKHFRSIQLDSSIADDALANTAYQGYLSRVADEKLLDALPRSATTPKYVGSEACRSCHQSEYRAWEKSAHHIALSTLAKTKNDRDPECVGCHVVGLDSQSGFRDIRTTPKLAGVGCESCHGPGAQHIKSVIKPYGKAGEKSCKQCHVADHSPDFDFKKFWPKIRH